MKVLSDIDISSKTTVFVRADLDVPLRPSVVGTPHLSELAEAATRLKNLRETVYYLIILNCKIIIAGHIDRPQKPDPALSTQHLVGLLEQLLNKKVIFKADIDTPVVDQVTLLENLRFWPGEVACDPAFAEKLVSLANVYVNDAFSDCHRSHASMVLLPKLLPHGAGFHLAKELEELTKLLKAPVRPFVAIVGGAKIETKLPVIENLAKIADFVLVGGELPLAIAEKGMCFPQNVLVANLEDGNKDISEESIRMFGEKIGSANTVVWNGPMGLFEKGFEKGTMVITQAILGSGRYSVVGGGETTHFLETKKLLGRFSFVSAGGGAMLEFLAGKELPALKALEW